MNSEPIKISNILLNTFFFFFKHKGIMPIEYVLYVSYTRIKLLIEDTLKFGF